MQVTQGAENVGDYSKTPQSNRKWCKICGGHSFTGHPDTGLTDVHAGVLADFPQEVGGAGATMEA